MVQCTQLSNGKPLHDLAMIFKKYLREYAVKVLEASIPKITTVQSSIGRPHVSYLTLSPILQSLFPLHPRNQYVFINPRKSAKSIECSRPSDPQLPQRRGNPTVCNRVNSPSNISLPPLFSFTKDELIKICCILTSAEYCLETVQQLEDKLAEKIDASFADKIDLSEEKDVFHKIISNCIQLLVQDLENGCEPALHVINKVRLPMFT